MNELVQEVIEVVDPPRGVGISAELDERLEGTAGAVAWLVANGAHVVRVHDVAAMVRVVRMVDSIRMTDG